MSNPQFSKINNTALQRVSGNVAEAAFIYGLRVLKGSFQPTDTDVYPLNDENGNQVVLGTTDCVLFVGVRNSGTDTTPSTRVYRASTPLGGDAMLADYISDQTIQSADLTVAGNEIFINVCSDGGIAQGQIDVTLVVLTL